MADRTLTINHADGDSETYTINRDKFAGVRSMVRAVNALPLTDSTTSIQVTVAGHADISGIYTGTTAAGATWNQQGGNGTITARSFNETDGYEYLLEDGSDSDPQYLLNNNAGFTDRPWKATIDTSITITGIAGTETITVDHTAVPKTVAKETTFGGSQSITIKRDIEPLLSKVVGGAAAAYSLRDLNDKAGNNKVVEVFRSSDNTSRDFLAKEVSNGTLEAWVGTGNDGFVSKWYDQSGNERHAEQGASTNQPKIVNSGSLVKLSDAPAISFDGSSQCLSTTGFSFSPSGDFLAVTVSKISNGNLIDTRDGGGDGFFLQQGSTFRHRYNGDGAINLSGSDQHILATSELNGTTLTAYKNGASAGTDTVTAGLSTTTNTTIGRISFTAANYVSGSIQEIILYDTDQSANRPAIEANINNQYDIY